MGVVMTTVFSGINVLYTFSKSDLVAYLSTAILPVVFSMYALSFFAQPRRIDWKTKLFLRFHFLSFGIFNDGLALLEHSDDKGLILAHVAIILLLVTLFHFMHKLRASTARLSDKDLSKFLIEALFKGGFKAMASVLFIYFRS